MERKYSNISERRLLADMLKLFKPIVRISTSEWAKSRRVIGSKETSFGMGNFNPDLTPYMEYVMECLDNPYISNIVAMKSARIGWTETMNNYTGNRIENNPTTMLIGFPTGQACKNYAKHKFPNFLEGVPVLKKLTSIDAIRGKENMYEIKFPSGSLSFRTLGSISNLKSDNISYIQIEEPDDVRDEVAGQGNSLDNLRERQKTIPPTMKKFVYGGTPTDKDFSKVEEGIKLSNWMVFKAECHCCQTLVPMDHTSFACIVIDDFPNRKTDPVYGTKDPSSAFFACPGCGKEWSFEQKTINIINGKKYGFIDHTGNFSKGWHPKIPEVTEVFGFHFSELLSTFSASSFIKLAEKQIIADIEKAKGNEGKLKSFTNNSMGWPYASGISAMEIEEMRALRKNYEEHKCPLEGLILFTGVDVQHNRFAIVTIAFGRNGNVYLVTWKEIFGNVLNKEDSVWQTLTEYCLTPIPHGGGNVVYIDAVSIDSGDGGTSELVYSWVRMMNEATRFAGHVRATKGVRELRYSLDEIYSPPREVNIHSATSVQQSLAHRMGVKVYSLGAHKAHDEILRRIGLNLVENCTSDVFYFNEQTYGGFEEQMLSCRKLVDFKKGYTVTYYQLISGRRKEAMDACKNAFHAAYAEGIKEVSNAKFEELEKYLLGQSASSASSAGTV